MSQLARVAGLGCLKILSSIFVSHALSRDVLEDDQKAMLRMDLKKIARTLVEVRKTLRKGDVALLLVKEKKGLLVVKHLIEKERVRVSLQVRVESN